MCDSNKGTNNEESKDNKRIINKVTKSLLFSQSEDLISQKCRNSIIGLNCSRSINDLNISHHGLKKKHSLNIDAEAEWFYKTVGLLLNCIRHILSTAQNDYDFSLNKGDYVKEIQELKAHFEQIHNNVKKSLFSTTIVEEIERSKRILETFSEVKPLLHRNYKMMQPSIKCLYKCNKNLDSISSTMNTQAIPLLFRKLRKAINDYEESKQSFELKKVKSQMTSKSILFPDYSQCRETNINKEKSGLFYLNKKSAIIAVNSKTNKTNKNTFLPVFGSTQASRKCSQRNSKKLEISDSLIVSQNLQQDVLPSKNQNCAEQVCQTCSVLVQALDKSVEKSKNFKEPIKTNFVVYNFQVEPVKNNTGKLFLNCDSLEKQLNALPRFKKKKKPLDDPAESFDIFKNWILENKKSNDENVCLKQDKKRKKKKMYSNSKRNKRKFGEIVNGCEDARESYFAITTKNILSGIKQIKDQCREKNVVLKMLVTALKLCVNSSLVDNFLSNILSWRNLSGKITRQCCRVFKKRFLKLKSVFYLNQETQVEMCETNTLKSLTDVEIDLMGMELTNAKEVESCTLLIKWKPPKCRNNVTGYEIYIDEVFKCKVYSNFRTCAVVNNVDLSKSLTISLFATSSLGVCEPPAQAIYKI